MYVYAVMPDSAWFLALPNGNAPVAMRDVSPLRLRTGARGPSWTLCDVLLRLTMRPD